MSSVRTDKAFWITAPVSKDGVEDSNVLRFTANTGAGWPRADALPKSWQGAFVTIRVTGCDLYWFFSKDSAVLPNVGIAAANDGAGDPLLGFLLKTSETMSVTIPKAGDTPGIPLEDIYFCRAGDAVGEVWMLRSSDA